MVAIATDLFDLLVDDGRITLRAHPTPLISPEIRCSALQVKVRLTGKIVFSFLKGL